MTKYLALTGLTVFLGGWSALLSQDPIRWDVVLELSPVAVRSIDIVHGGEPELVQERPGLRGIHFPTARHGWAVGSIGTIARTDNGGQTWTRERRAASSVTCGF